jgi:hypothetical protein
MTDQLTWRQWIRATLRHRKIMRTIGVPMVPLWLAAIVRGLTIAPVLLLP